jgi:hypothetical protein
MGMCSATMAFGTLKTEHWYILVYTLSKNQQQHSSDPQEKSLKILFFVWHILLLQSIRHDKESNNEIFKLSVQQ